MALLHIPDKENVKLIENDTINMISVAIEHKLNRDRTVEECDAKNGT